MDESTRYATRLWTSAQPTVAAFVAAVIRDYRDRDDVLQETALAVFESIDSYDSKLSFNAWAIGIARNQVGLYLRRRKRDRHVFDESTIACIESAFSRTSPSPKLDYLPECMQQLDGRAREMCELRYQEDLKPAAIADKLQMTATAPEGHVATLSSLLRVNISSPGTYSREDNLNVSELPAGQRIRSFTLFFHPEKAGPRQPPTQLTGSVTFDSPVLGLIVLHEELQASARRFTRFGPRNVRESQQLELSGNEDSDVITLSDDRRRVTLKLTARPRSGELMRVIVDASHQTSKEPTN